ncbi:MAG TPA: sensor histidine kinase [Rhodanobacteraceae bacterium]|nr:sensor histidine kinase [Rhodanobacteraceae bacterium]
MKLTIAPDSTLREALSESRGWYGRISHWVWLVWLVWLLGPVFFVRDGTFPHWEFATAASVPVFLVLYVAAQICSRRYLMWYALAVAGLCFAVTPYNPFAQTYIIYACALASAWNNPRKSAALVLVVVAAYSVQWLALGYPWESMLNAWILCPIIAGLIITERIQRHHRAELRLSQDEVRRLAARAERERIGRDLHDLLGHTLSLVALKSELAGRLIERDPVAARHEIDEVARVARDALAQVRSAVSGIRAAALVSELASARLLLETAGVQMEYWTDADKLPSNAETCLALVLREAVTNIQRHARANRVEVTVIAGNERVVMRIRDDGRGGVNARGNGLTGMRERIAACGGALVIESPRGRGTAIEVTMPLPDAPRKRDEQQPAAGVVVPLVRPAGSRA